MQTYTLVWSYDKTYNWNISNNYLNQDTPLDLIGIGYKNYGQPLFQNSVNLLSHFSNDTTLTNPITGTLQYNGTDTLGLWNSYDWKNIYTQNYFTINEYVSSVDLNSFILKTDIPSYSFVTSQYVTANYITVPYVNAQNYINENTVNNLYASSQFLSNIFTNFDNEYVQFSSLSTLVSAALFSQLSYVSQTSLPSYNYFNVSVLNNYIKINQTVTFSGDIIGSGTNNINSSLSTILPSVSTSSKLSVASTGRIIQTENLSLPDINTIFGATVLGNNSFDSSKKVAGYQYIAGNLIIQWMYGNEDSVTPTETIQSLTWPIPFPNNFFGAVVTTTIPNPTNEAPYWYQIDNNSSTLSDVVITRIISPFVSAVFNSTTQPFLIGIGN